MTIGSHHAVEITPTGDFFADGGYNSRSGQHEQKVAKGAGKGNVYSVADIRQIAVQYRTQHIGDHTAA